MISGQSNHCPPKNWRPYAYEGVIDVGLIYQNGRRQLSLYFKNMHVVLQSGKLYLHSSFHNGYNGWKLPDTKLRTHLLHNIVIRNEYPRKQEYTHSLWTRGPDHDLRLFITTYHYDYSGSCRRVKCIYI